MVTMIEGARVEIRRARPQLLPAEEAWDPGVLKLSVVRDPLQGHTLGDVGTSARVSGPDRFPATYLVLPVTADQLIGLDTETARVVRIDARSRTTKPIWSSGINLAFGFIWAEIRQPGTYAAIALPRDRLLQVLIRKLAQERRLRDEPTSKEASALAAEVLAPLLKTPAESLDQVRQLVSKVEVETGLPAVAREVVLGHNAEVAPFPLPHNMSLPQLRDSLEALVSEGRALPEEDLFFPPEALQPADVPWAVRPDRAGVGLGLDRDSIDRLQLPLSLIDQLDWGWLFNEDWWMYHHDAEHAGAASGVSHIARGSAHRLRLLHEVTLDGVVVSVPAVVDGHIYVGTSNNGSGGSLYRVNISTAAKTSYGVATPPGQGSRQGFDGIACTPAVTGGKVYFSALNGKFYCLHATTLAPVWITDLRNPDPAHNQPLQHGYDANGWSSPLVVHGRIYVGFGEGETTVVRPRADFGFVYCLDAGTGQVLWIFCTNKYSPGDGAPDNQPNQVPASTVPGGVLPGWATGFTVHADPDTRGAALWSSAAFSYTHNRIYIGTGNPWPDSALPSRRYSAGVIALDAISGAFQGFFQPTAHDSYRDTDTDIDVPAGPTVYWDGAREVVAFGSKNGSFFLLRSDTMDVLHRRQLLPYRNNDRNQPLPSIGASPALPPEQRENHFGVFGSAAVDYGGGRLFVGLGGYQVSIDNASTPFIRALSWTDLADAWPTYVDANGITKYTNATPPVYMTPREAGLSSPAVVNDVLLVSTTKPGLYVLRASDGLCLWAANDLGPAGDVPVYVLGPAIYGDYVVVGCRDKLRIYYLPPAIYQWPLPWRFPQPPIPQQPWPPPPPPPPWTDGRPLSDGDLAAGG